MYGASAYLSLLLFSLRSQRCVGPSQVSSVTGEDLPAVELRADKQYRAAGLPSGEAGW